MRPEGGARNKKASQDPSKKATREWVPPMLRKSRAVPLAVCCLVFIACLEILDLEVRRNEGLPADAHHPSTVRAAKYLPTVGVVALGFVWKALASDIKKVTPWSGMSGRWSPSSHSMLLDYITNIEIGSIARAARRKHGSLFLALTVGFLCGALAALANALTRLDLFALTSTNTTFERTTGFSFEQTLARPNYTLPIPYSHLGARPYAAVASERLPNGQFSPWTKNGYAFDSFTANASTLPGNATIEATVQSFRADFRCYPLDFSTYDASGYHGLEADASRYPDLNCSRPFKQHIDLGSTSAVIGTFKAWLNVSSCSEDADKKFIIANLLKLEPTKDDTDNVNVTSARGLICAPHFSVQDAVVRANASTGEIIAYWPNMSTATKVDTGTSAEAVWLYLNNPLDSKMQQVFSLNEINFTADREPSTNASKVDYAVSLIPRIYHTDPFFALLTNGEAELLINEYVENTEKLRADAEALANSIMAHVVSALARKNTSSSIPGSTSTRGPRLFLRELPLRVLQAALGLVACAALLHATLLRPRTVLQKDPGSIAAAAVLLSASDAHVETLFSREAVAAEKHMGHVLQPLSWQLHADTNQAVALRCRKLDADATPITPLSPGAHTHAGWRPVPLRLTSRIAVLVALVAAIVGLAVLLKLSLARNGLCEDTDVNSNAFALAPTAILILLGYACSGIDGAIRTISAYKSLWKGSKKQAVLFNLSDVPRIVAPFRTARVHSGVSLTASSIAILLIPVIKIVTAGLYSVTLTTATRQIQPLVDTSLVTHLESTYSLNDSDSSVQRASQFAEWSRTPSFNVPKRSGILDNLVFSNLTGVEHGLEKLDLTGAEISLTVPAIAVDVECKTAEMGVQAARKFGYDDCWHFYTECRSDECNDIFRTTCHGSECSASNSWQYIRTLSAYGGSADYDGQSCLQGQARFVGETFLSSAQEFQVMLADFSSIMGPVANTTRFGNYSKATKYSLYGVNYTVLSQWLEPGVLNVSDPLVNAVSCAATFSRVDVNATYARSTDSTWNPTRYDKESVRNKQEFNKSAVPDWMVPYAKYQAGIFNQYDSSTETSGLLSSNESLWPTRASSTNFFELLATYADYELGNLTALLEKDQFVAATKVMFEAYSTEMLTELRPFALNSAESDNVAPHAVDATLTFSQSRIVQDERTTIALEVLLGVMVCCFAWVFARFPSQSILPKSPGSIAARMSFLAQSRMVQRLREEKVARVVETQLWKEPCGLGWWPRADGTWDSENEDAGLESAGESAVSGAERSEGEDELSAADKEWRSRLRWGVDVGEDVVRESWKQPPLRATRAPSVDESAA